MAATSVFRQFAYDLEFKWGIHPVFPRAGSIAQTHRWAENEGVPQCGCGEDMELDEAADFWDADRRAEHGMRRGELAPDNARLRWKCADGVCRPETTYPRENPRLYTYLPRKGKHERVAMRSVLLSYRNIVESLFASLQNIGLAGTDQARPRWAGDDEMEWLVLTQLMFMTAKRVVHANGLYEQTLAEAEAFGLLQQASFENPSPGPTTHDNPRLKQLHDQRRRQARPPQGFPPLRP